jgi:hypothetical protein
MAVNGPWMPQTKDRTRGTAPTGCLYFLEQSAGVRMLANSTDLALRVLIEAADADVADALSVQSVLPSKVSGKTL